MGFVGRAVTDRLHGSRPSPPRALLAAAVAGASVAVITYKALRT